MHKRTFVALTLAALVSGCASLAQTERVPAELLSVFEWRAGDRPAGGISAIEVDDDGLGFLAVTDAATLIEGSFVRTDGQVTAVNVTRAMRLKAGSDRAVTREEEDSEGLAIAPDGTVWVSFEGRAPRVWSYPDLTRPAVVPPQLRAFRQLQLNSALEALAIDSEGVVYTLPERSGALDRPFPVYRFTGEDWDQQLSVPRRGDFLPVGADFGPDGKFYLLERRFRGIFGFATRVRRFDVTAAELVNEERVFETRSGVHDNLEGLSVWEDQNGDLRLTMVSDDNNFPLQRTEIVEYRILQ